MRIPQNIIAVLKCYAVALSLFSIFRLILFCTELSRLDSTANIANITLSFLMGIRFDVVIAGYILIVPFAILSLVYPLLSSEKQWVKHVASWSINAAMAAAGLLLCAACLVCAADIPFFNQFFSRFNVVAFDWMESPTFVFTMIVQEPRYWLAVIPFAASLYLVYRFLQRIRINVLERQPREKRWYWYGIATILFFVVMIGGIRGRVAVKSPIRVGTAYFCNNQLLNQLGLNPVFTLVRSALDMQRANSQYLALMNESKAIANVQTFLGIHHGEPSHPLSRMVSQATQGSASRYNVVVVLMESMSAAKMARHGSTKNVTPFLDSISHKGIYFENAYSAGIHTRNGIFSTFCSMPALLSQKPMGESAMYQYHGLATTLKAHGYSTMYCTTHDGQFDNVEGFLKCNDVEHVITSADYPSQDVKTAMGVPDDVLFSGAVQRLTTLHSLGKPFVAVMMTGSDHGPYYIPHYFKPHSKNIKDQATEYADYSLRKFITLSKMQKWFDSTLFVFVADHGAPLTATYEISLDYNHVPLLFYAPSVITNHRTVSNMAGQIDVFPTIMGILGLPYQNSTLGIDLFAEQRPYMYFTADDTYGVVDSTWLLVAPHDRPSKLYRYRNNDPRDYLAAYPSIAARMKEYAQSNMQTYQYVLRKKAM